MTLDYVKLAIIIIGTLLFARLALVVVRGTQKRFLLLGLLGGLCFYSGIGAASTAVDSIFILFYFIFFISIVIGFYISCSVFHKAGRAFGDKATLALERIDNDIGWNIVIFIYLLLSAVPLFYPELCIHRLFMPPAPDLRMFWSLRYVESKENIFTRLVQYGILLLTPFFYVALYRFRNRLWRVIIFFSLPLYFRYVANAYISRGEVMQNLLPVLLAAWFLRPNYRRAMILSILAMAPILLYMLYYYQRIRSGATVDISFTEAISLLMSGEFSFLETVAMPLFKAGERVNLGAYFTWIATIPIPKLLTGAIEGARINNEISEIIVGRPIGAPGFFIVLPGLVAESIYIYGIKFFWLHGVFCGFIAAIFARFMERLPQFIFLHCYVVFMVSYILNRGGIGSFLPPMVNQFFFFYIFLVFVFTFIWRPKQYVHIFIFIRKLQTRIYNLRK